MAHENLKVYLPGKPGQTFVANLTHEVYPWSVKIPENYINYRIFEEVTIREYNGRKNRWGDECPDHYRFDCVFFIEPGYRALNKRQVYTVGVELKNSKADLLGDRKMDHYIGYTDFFFIGVPSALVPEAVNRAKKDEKIGVFSVEDGKIYLLPQRILLSSERERDLLQQIMYSRMFQQDFKNKVSIKLEDVEIMPMKFKDTIEREFVLDTHIIAQVDNSPTAPENSATMKTTGNSKKLTKEAARDKEQLRRERHEAKVAALQEEVSAMNEEVPQVVVSILEGLSLGDQRVYHVIRRHGGIQAQNIAEVLPYQDGVGQPSLATVKRCIRVLTNAGLVERLGSRKTGKYVIKEVDCDDSCQVCAKSPLCKDFKGVQRSSKV